MSPAKVIFLFAYDHQTGNLIWRHNQQIAGCVKKVGDYKYLYIRHNCADYIAQRLVWLYHNKSEPDGKLRHINGDTLDNRIENLQVIIRKRRPKGEKKEPVGAYAYKGKWLSQIKVNGRVLFLGYHKTKEDAQEAFKAAKRKYAGGNI